MSRKTAPAANKYREFGAWVREVTGFKCQKIGVNAGFTCPNRDGSLGTGGCTFCNNQSFNPDYAATSESVTQQLEAGKLFFGKKYPEMKYLAYFQAYTSTYAPTERCIARYEEALRVSDVVGLVISTRPDCMPSALLDYLEALARERFVLVEYGIESANDETLRRVNRGHDFATAERAIRETASRGIYVGAHIILGLPSEDHDELMRQADIIARLPLTTLKLHQLQIIRGTRMEQDYLQHPWPIPTAEQYAALAADYLRRLPCGLVTDRFVSQSPSELLVAPRWGLKQQALTHMIKERL